MARRRRKQFVTAFRLLKYGMDGTPCWHLVITQGRRVDPGMRADLWYRLRTRMRQVYPQMAACTVIEWSNARGVHMHVVIRDAPDFNPVRMQNALVKVAADVDYYCVPVAKPVGLAIYLTKGLQDSKAMEGWPRFFRPFSATQNWPRPPDDRPTPGDSRLAQGRTVSRSIIYAN